MTLGDRIHYLRTEKGYTLQELGDMVGVGASTVRKWETGYIKTLRTDKMQKLSNALGTSVDYLMGWTDNSVNVGTVGTNNGVIGQNSGEIRLEQQRSKEEAELLRIFSGLDVKRRMELLMTAIRLDEEQRGHNYRLCPLLRYSSRENQSQQQGHSAGRRDYSSLSRFYRNAHEELPVYRPEGFLRA